MSKTIRVKGSGSASAKVDCVELVLDLQSQDMEYEEAMNQASFNIDSLSQALQGIGFKKDTLKTSRFDVDTVYKNVRRTDDSYARVFEGYCVSHRLKLSFDFDMELLAKTLSTIGSCEAHPELFIHFKVKDNSTINEEMLKNATENAFKKAQVLCEAAHVTLGDLLSIDYSWGEIEFESATTYGMNDLKCASAIDIEPEDIEVSDTATFVWEIK